jgi:hypothetical protein
MGSDPNNPLGSSDPEEAALAARLVKILADAGAPDPAAWASSEIFEGIPQVARYLLLASLRRRAVAPWTDREHVQESVPVAADLLAQEVGQDQVTGFATAVAREVVDEVLRILDLGFDEDLGTDAYLNNKAPGWAVVETTAEAGETGRFLTPLRESWSSVDR